MWIVIIIIIIILGVGIESGNLVAILISGLITIVLIKSAIEVNKEGKEVKKKEKQVRQEYDQMQPEIERMKLKIAEAEKYILYSGDLEAMSILEIAKNDSTEYFQILNGSKNKGNTTMNHVINMFLEGGDYTDAEISLLVNYSICSIESDARMASINNL